MIELAENQPVEVAGGRSRSPRWPPGNAAANTAADQIEVAQAALEQIPAGRASEIDVLLRVDSAGAAHGS